MKWWEVIGVIVVVGALLQFISWILESLKFKENLGQEVTFFLSTIFTFLIIVVIILVQIQKENRKTKEFLYTKGFKKEEGAMEKLFKKGKKGKKGVIDPRILLFIIILFILYLLYKAGTIG